ncbi:alpha-1,3-galactosidase B [Bacteroidia bacterium]|nr:alpha-1,3-galactosidase B [Bacteroidia bacterium]
MKLIKTVKITGILLTIAFSQSVAARDSISVADFGLKPNTRENAVPYVQKTLEACKGKTGIVLVFPRGRYDFWPQHCIEREYFESNSDDTNPRRLAILIEQQEGLTVDGSGSDFVFHDRMQPFTIDNSRNITIRNVSIDWDIPLLAQAVVLQANERYIDLQINSESPYIIENDKLVFVGEGWRSEWWGLGGTMEFEKNSRIVTPQTGDRASLRAKNGHYRAEELATGKVRIHSEFTRIPAVGNFLVLRHSHRDHAGTFVIDSKNVQFENFNMYHNCGLGILLQFSENLTFTNVNSIPNEKKGRVFAGHDDGLHFSNCKGDIVIKKCTFQGLMDDPINVHGTSVRVIEKVDDFTLRCKLTRNDNRGLLWARPGESVGFIENTSLHTFATGTVKSFRDIDTRLFDLSFQEAIPQGVIAGNALENLTWNPNVLITDSYFKSCRARGILVSTPGKVVIENNIFESSGSAILIAGDANQWYETGAVKDVLITKNIFRAPCMTSMYQFCEGVISIMPEIPQKTAKTPAFHHNIVITDNEFHLYDYPILYAFSAENIEFSKNKLIRSRDYEPFHQRKDGLTFEFCKKISVKGNTVEGDVLGNTIKLINTSNKECNLGKDSFFRKYNTIQCSHEEISSK